MKIWMLQISESIWSWSEWGTKLRCKSQNFRLRHHRVAQEHKTLTFRGEIAAAQLQFSQVAFAFFAMSRPTASDRVLRQEQRSACTEHYVSMKQATNHFVVLLENEASAWHAACFGKPKPPVSH